MSGETEEDRVETQMGEIVVSAKIWTQYSQIEIQSVPEEKVNILGGHSTGHSKQKSLYVLVSYSQRFPR
jgi:hypothetical protein